MIECSILFSQHRGSEHLAQHLRIDPGEFPQLSQGRILLEDDLAVAGGEDLEGLRPGTPAAFQFDRYSAWPEHDAVEFSAQAW